MNSRGVNLAALWLALASIETVLHLVNAESALRSRQLPYAIRLGLLGFDLLSIWILIAAASAAWSLVRYCLPKRQALLSLCRRTLTFCFWIFLVLYGATWGLFYAASSFLNKDSLLFWAAQPIQILHWVPPGFTFGTLAGAAIVAWALAELLPMRPNSTTKFRPNSFRSCGSLDPRPKDLKAERQPHPRSVPRGRSP